MSNFKIQGGPGPPAPSSDAHDAIVYSKHSTGVLWTFIEMVSSLEQEMETWKSMSFVHIVMSILVNDSFFLMKRFLFQ